ncbi:alpha-1,2-fucosyltransferase [Planctomycetota bacterium]
MTKGLALERNGIIISALIIQLRGGLGNQMFQYAYGRAQALRHNMALRLDLSYLQQTPTKPNRTARDYRLNVFDIDIQFADTKETCLFRNKLGKQLNKINIFLLHRERKPLWKTLLVGYWQSPTHFSEIESILRDDFRFKPLESQAAVTWSRDIVDQPNSVMLHVRHGDYEGHAIHEVCSLKYYQAAMLHVQERVVDPHFYIFSDDISWCRTQFQEQEKIRHMSFIENCRSEAEEMQLMTLCKHHIISNSTFSWWGAWLGKKPEQVVLTPHRWFRDETLNEQFMIREPILPQEWTSIQVKS